MIRVPDPILPDVGAQARILYTLSFALVSGILSKFEFFGSVAWIFFGYSLQWTWLSFPVFKVERSHGLKSTQSRRDKAPKNEAKLVPANSRTVATTLPSKRLENATQYPRHEVVLDFSFDQVVHGFFHKYAEIPDPNFPEILSISVDIDETLANGLIRKRRTFTLKNEEDMPYVLRKMLSADTVQFEENCIIDMKNKTLEMCTHNKSFSNLGQMLDFQYLKVDPNDENKTVFVETGEVSLFGVPWMLRSQGEKLVVEGFEEKFQESLDYFKMRLATLFPAQEPQESVKEAPTEEPSEP